MPTLAGDGGARTMGGMPTPLPGVVDAPPNPAASPSRFAALCALLRGQQAFTGAEAFGHFHTTSPAHGMAAAASEAEDADREEADLGVIVSLRVRFHRPQVALRSTGDRSGILMAPQAARLLLRRRPRDRVGVPAAGLHRPGGAGAGPSRGASQLSEEARQAAAALGIGHLSGTAGADAGGAAGGGAGGGGGGGGMAAGLDAYHLQQEVQLRLVRLAAFIAAEDVDMRAGVRWLPKSRFTSERSTPKPHIRIRRSRRRSTAAATNTSPARPTPFQQAEDEAQKYDTFQASDGHLLTQVLEHAEVQLVSSVFGLPEALRDALAASAQQRATPPLTPHRPTSSPATSPPGSRTRRWGRSSKVPSSASAASSPPDRPGRSASAPTGPSPGVGAGAVVEEYSQMSVSLPALYIYLHRNQFTQVMGVVRRVLLAPIPARPLPKLAPLSDLSSAFNETAVASKRNRTRRSAGNGASHDGAGAGAGAGAGGGAGGGGRHPLGSPAVTHASRGSDGGHTAAPGFGSPRPSSSAAMSTARTPGRADATPVAATTPGPTTVAGGHPVSTLSQVTKRVEGLLAARSKLPEATQAAEQEVVRAWREAASEGGGRDGGGAGDSFEASRPPPKRIRVVEYDMGFLRWTLLSDDMVRPRCAAMQSVGRFSASLPCIV